MMKINNDFKGNLVSIVTYNNSAIIGKVISSIIENTKNVDYKIVVFDNASTDDTIDKVKSLKSDRVEIISSKVNYGFGYGHNRNAESYPNALNYIIYNPDLFLTDNLIHDYSSKLIQNEKIGMLLPKVEYPNGNLQYLCKRNPTFFDLFMRRFLKKISLKFLKERQKYYEMRDKNYNTSFSIEYASGCCMFIRGSLYREIGGFDEKFFMYLEDADITRRINKTHCSVYEPSNRVLHIWNKGAHHSTKLMWINIKSAIYYFRKWGWDLY